MTRRVGQTEELRKGRISVKSKMTDCVPAGDNIFPLSLSFFLSRSLALSLQTKCLSG